jgi:DNA-directed RNA polymerase specialized sigma subunit
MATPKNWKNEYTKEDVKRISTKNIYIAEGLAVRFFTKYKHVYVKNYIEVTDLINDAIVLMCEAIPRYDDKKGSKIESFLYMHICAKLLTHLNNLIERQKDLVYLDDIMFNSDETSKYDSTERDMFLEDIKKYVKNNLDDLSYNFLIDSLSIDKRNMLTKYNMSVNSYNIFKNNLFCTIYKNLKY